MTAKEAPYIAEIAPLDGSAPFTAYQVYTTLNHPNQFCFPNYRANTRSLQARSPARMGGNVLRKDKRHDDQRN